MAPVNKESVKVPDPAKRRRRVYTLQEKIDIIKKISYGATFAAVGREYGANESTVRSVYKVRADVMKAFTEASSRSVSRIVRVQKDQFLQPMEKGVFLWMEDCYKKKLPVTTKRLQSKARYIYNSLVERSDVPDKEKHVFQASRGWLQKFLLRYAITNRVVSGETASADAEAARRYPQEFHQVIQEGGYLPCQVFNASKTALFWKRMPDKSYLAKEEARMPGFKAAKDRVSLLFCANASGDYKCKPLLIHRSARPCPFKNISMLTLPVHWRANKKGWITQTIFEEWFMTHFRTEMKNYCAKKNITFKVILLLDNCTGHPTNLNDLQSEIKVIYLPPQTTSLLQPMDQEVMSTFKLLYLDLTFEAIHKAIDEDKELTVQQYWRNKFNILHGVRFIGKAWAAIGETCLLNGWCKLLPDTAPDFLGFEQDHLTWVLNRARALPGEGFEDLQSADIINLVEAAEQELPDSDILQLIDESPNDPGLEEEDEEHVEPSPTLTMSNLARILSLHQQLIDLISEADPSFERRETLTLNLTRGIAPYKQIYQERQATAKKPMFTTFFRGFSASPTPVPVPATPQHEEQQEPTPSPLGVTHAHASTPTVSDSDSGPDNPPSPPSPTTSEADTHTYDDDNDASSMDVDVNSSLM
ncbi:tigger transposable element-derived protein 1-like [Homarus americanus]|uniref:tigger transposable element-derived protein 1-like n=1 Tax=Homarus americanus TaxID=6706 RepID=UPI001C458A63|nr:tigger transposable element-derived protein 1-like [Homarus americanus]